MKKQTIKEMKVKDLFTLSERTNNGAVVTTLENGNKYFDELETKREIATMKEVLKMPGRSMIEKVNNAINAWDDEKQITRRTDNNRYKLKYKY